MKSDRQSMRHPAGRRSRPRPASRTTTSPHDDGRRRPQSVKQALITSELRYRCLFETAQDGILILDGKTGAIEDANPYLVKMLGYPAEELLGKKLWEFDAFPDLEASQQGFRDLQMQGCIRCEDFPLRTKGGQPLEVEFLGSLHREGTLSLIQCNMRDITSRKNIERERERLGQLQQAARAEAEKAVETREQFLKVATHELRSPLSTLLGYVDVLARQTAQESSLSQSDRRALAVISKQAWRLDRLISSLFDVSHLQGGQLEIHPTLIDLGALAGRIVDEAKSSVAGHTLKFSGVPEPLMVRGDGARLVEVLQNLIGNAIKYSPGGGTVRVEAARREEMACVAVIDYGIGIPAEEAPHIFDRFYRARNAREIHPEGLGVGLYVAKEIVRLHGGYIELASTLGEGSTFTVGLPLADSD